MNPNIPRRMNELPIATPATERLQLTEKERDRIWRRIKRRGPDECWEWQGPIEKNGYARVWFRRKNEGVHRIVCESENGLLGDLYALHRCDNRRCANPAHIFAGTPLDNMRDMIAKGRRRQGFVPLENRITGDRHWSRRHPERVPRGDDNPARKYPERMPRGERVGTAKLTAELVVQLRRRRSEGATFKKIGGEFGITAGAAFAIASRRLWRHVP